MRKPSSSFLLLLVFAAGMTTMAVEMAASRLLAPYFGDSLIVWASLIGLILVYLSAGYWLGGRWADRHPRETALYQVTAWAGFSIGLVPFVARPILRFAAFGFARFQMGLLLGSLGGVLLLFALPITLLGCVSPFAVRLMMREVQGAGRVAGLVYALSTLGSIVGTFLPVLLLIPAIGTRRTFSVLSLALLGLSLIGLARARSRWTPFFLLLFLLLVALTVVVQGPIKAGPDLVYEEESARNYIRVSWEEGRWVLRLNEGEAIQSVYDPDSVLQGGLWDYFLIVPYFNRPPYGPERVGSLLLIGLAGGTVAREYTAIYGPIPIEGVEIDPRIIAVGRRFFGMDLPNLKAIARDGRYYLQHSGRHYDVIIVDAYRPPYIPFHLATREFFALAREHLTDEGVLVVNAICTDTDYGLVNALARTMRAVFPSVYIIDVPSAYNSLVVGTRRPTSLENFVRNMEALTHPLLREVAAEAFPHIRVAGEEGLLLTDDHAPVEHLVHRLILSYWREREVQR